MLIGDHLRDRPPTAPLPPVRTAHQQSRGRAEGRLRCRKVAPGWRRAHEARLRVL
jgi:hypothetical protein